MKYRPYGSIFIKQHSETVMAWYYQNADCSLKKLIYYVTYYNFRLTFVAFSQRSADECLRSAARVYDQLLTIFIRTNR